MRRETQRDGRERQRFTRMCCQMNKEIVNVADNTVISINRETESSWNQLEYESWTQNKHHELKHKCNMKMGAEA